MKGNDSMSTNWYAKNAANDSQGLIIEEKTGRNVAVAYDRKDAALLAAAPQLLASLRFLADACETEPAMQIYRDHIAQAYSAIAAAEGR